MSRFDWRLLGCFGLFLWPIPGNLMKIHASSEPASNSWTKPFDTTKHRIFTTRWTSGRFRDLAMENFRQVSWICIPNKIQLASTEKQETWGWDEISLACLVYHWKIIIKIKHEESKRTGNLYANNPPISHLWTSHQAADVQLWLNVGIQPQRMSKHQCSIQVIPTAKRRCFHANLAVVVVFWRAFKIGVAIVDHDLKKRSDNIPIFQPLRGHHPW